MNSRTADRKEWFHSKYASCKWPLSVKNIYRKKLEKKNAKVEESSVVVETARASDEIQEICDIKHVWIFIVRV